MESLKTENTKTNTANVEQDDQATPSPLPECGDSPDPQLTLNEQEFFDLKEDKGPSEPDTPDDHVGPANNEPEEFDFDRAMEVKHEGRNLFFQKKYFEASEKFEEALAFCPLEKKEDRVKLLSNLAICMMKLGQFESAVGYCNDALALDELWSKARYNRAESCFQLQKFDKALDDLKRVFEERPDLYNEQMLRVGPS